MMKSGKWSSVCRRRQTFHSKNANGGIAGVRAAGMKILVDRRRLYEAHASLRTIATDEHRYSQLSKTSSSAFDFRSVSFTPRLQPGSRRWVLDMENRRFPSWLA